MQLDVESTAAVVHHDSRTAVRARSSPAVPAVVAKGSPPLDTIHEDSSQDAVAQHGSVADAQHTADLAAEHSSSVKVRHV